MIAALAQTKDERKGIESAKTRFLSITSHELRSPMTPLKAQLQMLEGEYFGKLNEKQKEAVSIVVRNADHLDRIIVDFLEISRIEAARLKFLFEKVSLNKSVQELLSVMKGFMPEKKIKIISKISKLPVIEVDAERVNQVLRNLINNAIKFSKDNGTVEVTAKVEQNHMLFSVKDNGIGMKDEDQRRIFEPFYQAEQTMYRKKGGTGLGLAICRGIVESQNGKIWLDSEVGKGLLRRKIGRLKLEAKKTKELIKKLQKECFIGKKISTDSYKEQAAKYEERINEIKQTLPVLEAELKGEKIKNKK
jgi:signal transduction histidine kinase